MTFSADLFAAILGFLLTLMIFTYLLGDNPLFRIATYLFVGATAGYVAVVAFWEGLWPKLLSPLRSGTPTEPLLLVIPLIGMGLMLLKVSPRLSGLGQSVMAYLAGVSAAVAVGGAMTGTLFPQSAATINAFGVGEAMAHGISPLEALFNATMILLGVVTSLAYFHFGARLDDQGEIRRPGWIEALAWLGRIFITMTLGVLFAGLFSAALTALLERLAAIATLIGF
ncbi:MAG: hypothetical protein ACP5QU_04645 [Anaerolineae bacterium]